MPSGGSIPAAPPPEASSAPPVEAPPAWLDLARARRYRDAMREAAPSFDALCASLGPADLALLGDAARFSGDTGRGRQALTALRRRYPGDAHAATAAFTLGRIAFDQQRSPGEAAGWFSTYLSELPGGPLAQEALGRLIEARQQAGDTAGARHAAQQYLARFPGGAHEAIARRLVEPAPGP